MIRRKLHDRRSEPVIPWLSDQRLSHGYRPFDRAACRKRNTVEHCVRWLNEHRRFAMRHAKRAEDFLAMIDLAVIQR
jgi:transposase